MNVLNLRSPPMPPPAPVSQASAYRFAVAIRHVGPWTVVCVTGELESASLPTLSSVLSVVGPDVVLDLGEVTFIDASGLGGLARWARLTRLRGGSLTVANPSRRVRRLMLLTRMDHALSVVDSVDDATSAPPVRRGRSPR